MTKRTIVGILVLLSAACAWSSLRTVEMIGDFQTLENWSGLEHSSTRDPGGRVCARLSFDKEAVYTYTQMRRTIGREHPGSGSFPMHESQTADWFGYRVLCFDVFVEHEPVELEVCVYPLACARGEYPQQVTAKAVAANRGWNRIYLDFSDFSGSEMLWKLWSFVDRVGLTAKPSGDGTESGVLISQIRLQTAREVALSCPVLSKPADEGETAVYEISVANLTDRRLALTLRPELTGSEALQPGIFPSYLVLDPQQGKTVEVRVEMNGKVPPGGYEEHRIRVTGSDVMAHLDLITVRRLPHPYILHIESGWDEVKDKIKTRAWAAAEAEQVVSQAARRVPKSQPDTDYVFALNDYVLNLQFALVWKLTGEDEYARKCAEFLRRFADPQTGYIAKLRSTSGSPVHDGRSFQEVAKAYDLIYDSGFLTPEDHLNLERALRNYMQHVDWFLGRGDHNNHHVSLVTGALLSSLVLQDVVSAKRFIEGPQGIYDLLSKGILDDGTYFECAMNYNMITAGFFLAAAQACLPWGWNIHEMPLSPEYGDAIFYSPWAVKNTFLGMSFDRYGPVTRNIRTMKDLFDSLYPLGDYRQVAFANNDSFEVDFTGEREFGEGFAHAYALWRDPAYLPIVRNMKKRGLLYEPAELPDAKECVPETCRFDNAGFAVLRSTNDARPLREQIQAVLKYGTHGGYHGHFDRLSLLSLMRYGKSFYNTECAWYGYDSFLFKMWVQTSMAHNMAVVDAKMQKPSECEDILFHSGKMMQAAAAQTTTVWIDPPYGGQTPYPEAFPEEKSWQESRWLPVPETVRPQGATGQPSESVFQRRLLIVTDNYTITADYLRAENEHNFDCLMHIKGFQELLSDNTEFLQHTGQFNTDPFGAGQFITDCNWYRAGGTARLRFNMLWADGVESGGRRSQSAHGPLTMDLYSVWPTQRDMVLGSFPENLGVARKVWYTVRGDGNVLAEGRLAPWILGTARLDVPVTGIKTLELITRVEPCSRARTLFWAEPKITTGQGETLQLGELPGKTENIFKNSAAGRDYYDGPVKLAGHCFGNVLPAEPTDTAREAITRIDLSGTNAERLSVVLGGDYPLGDETLQRKTVSVRSVGKEALFVNLIEAYETGGVVESIQASESDEWTVTLKDGRRHDFRLTGFNNPDADVAVQMSEWKDGKVIKTEETAR